MFWWLELLNSKILKCVVNSLSRIIENFCFYLILAVIFSNHTWVVTLPPCRLAINHSNAIGIHVHHLRRRRLLRWTQHVCIYGSRGKSRILTIKTEICLALGATFSNGNWSRFKFSYRMKFFRWNVTASHSPWSTSHRIYSISIFNSIKQECNKNLCHQMPCVKWWRPVDNNEKERKLVFRCSIATLQCIQPVSRLYSTHSTEEK